MKTNPSENRRQEELKRKLLNIEHIKNQIIKNISEANKETASFLLKRL